MIETVATSTQVTQANAQGYYLPLERLLSQK